MIQGFNLGQLFHFAYDDGEAYVGFHADMVDRFKFHGVQLAMRHCLWADGSPFGYEVLK